MGESTRYLINNLINKRERGNSICVIFRGRLPAKNNTKKVPHPGGGELFSARFGSGRIQTASVATPLSRNGQPI